MSKEPVVEIKFPADIDWNSWIERLDKMLDHYITMPKGRMRAITL